MALRVAPISVGYHSDPTTLPLMRVEKFPIHSYGERPIKIASLAPQAGCPQKQSLQCRALRRWVHDESEFGWN